MQNSSDVFFGTSGPRNARIAIVGEAWGQDEFAAHLPFVGASGRELDRMLGEAGIARSDCFVTNVIPERPYNNELAHPDFFHKKAEAKSPPLAGLYPTEKTLAYIERLSEQLRIVNPTLVIAAGNYALWALSTYARVTPGSDESGRRTGFLVPSGIGDYRGSMVRTTERFGRRPLLPIYHPALILRQWAFRATTVHDLRFRVPLALSGDWDRPTSAYTIIFEPSADEAIAELSATLATLDAAERPLRLTNDIETARGLITCVGLTLRARYALTIPFIRKLPDNSWEAAYPRPTFARVLDLLRRILTHPNALIEGQNYLYDIQYIRKFLGVLPRCDFDTMSAQHVLFPGTPKGAADLSSIYCHYHWHWKDDNKEWDVKGDLSTHLRYNAEDILRQYEFGGVLRELIATHGLSERFERQMARWGLALRMMLRGVRVDTSARQRQLLETMRVAGEYAQWLHSIVPQRYIPPSEKTGLEQKTPWFNSAQQTMWVLYKFFGMKGKRHRKTGNVSSGKEALNDLRGEYPQFASLFDHLSGLRSLGIFSRNFLSAPLDPDGRMRCFFNPAGTETFRFSSSENAFGSGTNLQNIPKGNED